MGQVGRGFLVFGALLLLVGGALIVAEKLGLGRLPGDLVVERKGFRLYAPLATSHPREPRPHAARNLFLRR